MGKEQTILIVEDQPAVRELYKAFLEEEYAVRTADSVSAAVESVDEAVDVVLLDRRLPDGPGRDVLEAIRSRRLPCRVAMVTAVVPDYDIVDLGFDHYVVKPVSKSELVGTVEALLERREYGEKVRRLSSLVSKRVGLEGETPQNGRAASDEYDELDSDIRSLQSDIDDISTGLTTIDFRAMFRDIERAT